MRYYTWKLKWVENIGTDPTFTLNNGSVRIEPMFSIPGESKENDIYYAVCLEGSINTNDLIEWDVQETTEEDVLIKARQLNINAEMISGRVQFPNV
jgi:hypothetical protein